MTRSDEAKTIRYPAQYPGFGALVLGWLVLGGMAYTRHLLLMDDPYSHILPDLSGWMTCYLPWILLTPLVFTLERRFPLNRPHWARHLGWLAAGGLPILYLACVITLLLNAMLRLVLPQTASVPVIRAG